jgi:hypothetical protein
MGLYGMTTLKELTYLIIYSDGENEYSATQKGYTKSNAVRRFDPWEEFEIVQVTKIPSMQEDLEFVK